MADYASEFLMPAWQKLMRDVLDRGDEVSPRGLKTRELTNVSIKITNPTDWVFDHKLRKASPVMAAVELMYFLNGRDDDVLAAVWLQGMDKYVNPFTRRFDGGYGPSISIGVSYCLAMLAKDPDTRRAWIPIMDKTHLVRMIETNDYPCNPSISFVIRGGRLDMTVVTRSQDLFYGYIYDQLEFHMLLGMMATALKYKVGEVNHYVQSLHLYERDWANANECAEYPVNCKSSDFRFPFNTSAGFWKYVRLFNRLVDIPEEEPRLEIYDDLALSVHGYAVRKQGQVAITGPFTAWLRSWQENRK